MSNAGIAAQPERRASLRPAAMIRIWILRTASANPADSIRYE